MVGSIGDMVGEHSGQDDSPSHCTQVYTQQKMPISFSAYICALEQDKPAQAKEKLQISHVQLSKYAQKQM